MQQVHQLRNKGILCLLLLLKKTAVRQSASSLSMDGCKRHIYQYRTTIAIDNQAGVESLPVIV